MIEEENNSGESIVKCECRELKPTTIVNDLKNIFIDSNASKVFSSAGAEAFKDFEFYLSVIFYVFLF